MVCQHFAFPGMHASRDSEEAGLRGAEPDWRGAIESGTQISEVGVKHRAGEACRGRRVIALGIHRLVVCHVHCRVPWPATMTDNLR